MTRTLAERIMPFIWDTTAFGILGFILIKARHPHLSCNFRTRLSLDKLGGFSFGKSVTMHGVSAKAGLRVGDHTYIQSGGVISCSEEHPVVIGKRCSIAAGVYMSTGDHPVAAASSAYPLFGRLDEACSEAYESTRRKGRIEIGNDVWIGYRACILRGVRIGDGAIVGAGAVVTKDVEPYSVVGGVPAGKIRDRFSARVRRQLAAIRWWDWDEGRIERNKRFFSTDLEKYGGELLELVRD